MIAFVLAAAALCLTSCGPSLPRQPSMTEIRRSVARILELPTYEQLYRDVVYIDKSRPILFLKIGGTEVLFSVNIRVKAGIDLAGGMALERTGPHSIAVRLPPAKVLSVDAEEQSIREYFVHRRVLSRVSQLDYYDAIEPAKERIVEEAVAGGILTRARDNARSLVEGLLRGGGYERVSFIEEVQT